MATDIAGLVDRERGLVSRRIFVEDEIYQQELERIFARCWLFLGHETQVPRPGDFVTTYMGEDSVILCRDAHGQLHGLLNTCRHRGNRVCRLDQGRAHSFTCTYHGWTYSLEGRLVGVPGYDELYHGELDLEQWSLVPVAQIASYKGLVFATFDPEAPPLEEYLGEMLWTMDIMLDQRASGTEVVGGVFKWVMNCNWKLGADNFIGDNYHGFMTHRSAMLVGHSTSQRNPQLAEANRLLADRPGYTLSTSYGHGCNLALRPAGQPPTPRHLEPLPRYYQQTAAEAERRLGTHRARDVVRFNMTLFPNFSLSSSSGMLHVWHPKGPQRTEVWLYTLVDREAPPEVKNAFRLSSQQHFSPSGLFEQDDGENWEQSTLAARGAIARRYPLNYQMGLGQERRIENASGPERLEGLVNEHNQRQFYRRWSELMAGQAWPPSS